MTEEVEDALRFDGAGLLPTVVQHVRTGQVLMLGYMDREALQATLASGDVHFHSRSRGVLWRKGETSGNVLRLEGVSLDCDGDALLVAAEPSGPTCHTGAVSCFHRPLEGRQYAPGVGLGALSEVLRQRLAERPEGSYTVALADDPDRLLRKLVEEVTEVVLAVKNGDRANLVWELADVLYHLAALMAAQEVTAQEVREELERRRGGGPR